MHRRRTLAAFSLILSAPLLGLASPLAASAAGPVSVLTGTTPETTVFPNDVFTVPDADQLSGRRVSVPVPACDST